MIQGILLSHYLHSVNLGNYGLPHVPKSVTPKCAFTCDQNKLGPSLGALGMCGSTIRPTLLSFLILSSLCVISDSVYFEQSVSYTWKKVGVLCRVFNSQHQL